jgi:hypothetical protein
MHHDPVDRALRESIREQQRWHHSSRSVEEIAAAKTEIQTPADVNAALKPKRVAGVLGKIRSVLDTLKPAEDKKRFQDD